MNQSIQCVFIHCMDYRIQDVLDQLLEHEVVPYGNFDRIVVAGGAGAFDDMEKQLALSAKLHHPSFALLTIHEECGGGATEADFAKAEEIALKYVPLVKKYYVYKDQNQEWTFRLS